MADIRRIYASKVITIPSGSSLSTAPVDMRRVSDGTILSPSGFTSTNLGFKVSSASDGVPVPLYNHVPEIVEIVSPSANTAFKLPSDLYSAHWVWLWAQSASGTNTDQASNVSFTFLLKS